MAGCRRRRGGRLRRRGRRLVSGRRSRSWTGAVERTALPRSVAVLPCQNLSPRAEDEYFAAGMHEEVLDHLARIRDVNVIASTSVQRYAGSGVPIPAIAVDLNVGASSNAAFATPPTAYA